jgi:type VI secretion system protein ImpA
MALPENLLTPIPGENPSGKNLRYDPVYDKLKEARRREEDLPSGDWASEVKRADWKTVYKLSTEALGTKTKDLQIAAWLTECLLSTEGFPGLNEGLQLLKSYVETFWDTLYPEIEDGDLELRAAPLEWVGTFLETQARRTALTKSSYDFFKHKECRTVGYEKDVEGNDAKIQERQEKISEGKLTPEEWDSDVAATSLAFYQKVEEGLRNSLESLEALGSLCDEKFGNVAPSFGKLRTALEEVHHLVKGILKAKAPAEEEAPAAEEGGYVEEAAAEGEAGEAAPRARRVMSEEPADIEDAVRRLGGVAKFWRAQDATSPVPYLVLRGLRWGELRASGPSPDMMLLEAPPTEVRQEIKRLSLEGNWAEVLEKAELAMAQPCGRAWLDLQRYVIRACTELTYENIQTAVLGELRALLQDYPQLPEWTLMDDTPTANPETQAWLKSIIAPPPASADESAVAPMVSGPETPGAPDAPKDAHELALEAVKKGRKKEAMEIMARAVAQERIGRSRFMRMVQFASVCLTAGHENMAFPILRELAEEIERRKLEEWETREVLAQPLALYYRCLEKLGHDEAEKQTVYERLCRLDPMQALAVQR